MATNDILDSFGIGRQTKFAIQIVDIHNTKSILHRSIQMLQLTEEECECTQNTYLLHSSEVGS